MKKYNILYELRYYDGPLEGVCFGQDDHQAYYYCTFDLDVTDNRPRRYYIYMLRSDGGRSLPLEAIITEEQLKK